MRSMLMWCHLLAALLLLLPLCLP
eukprot:COSAG06_NODE_14403_length_1159_cov_103.878302_2_plen_23_part_01